MAAARLLMSLAEHEVAERDRRRIERHLAEAKLLPEKTLDNFDFAAVPMISKAQVSAQCAGDGWLEKGANLLLFGPPGGGKSHLASAQRSDSLWSRKAGEYCLHAPRILSNDCK